MKLHNILEAQHSKSRNKVRSITFFTAVDDAWECGSFTDGAPPLPIGDMFSIEKEDPRVWFKQAYEREFSYYRATPKEKREFKLASKRFMEETQDKRGIYLSFGWEYDDQLTFIEGSSAAIGNAIWEQWTEMSDEWANRDYDDAFIEKKNRETQEFIQRLVS